MLRAIGIYEISDTKTAPSQFKRIESAQLEKNTFFSNDDLKNLEDNSLLLKMPSSGVAYHQAYGEHHYLRKIPSSHLVIAIVSKKELDAIELCNLFTNIQTVHFKKPNVKVTLDQMVANPLGYTGRDLIISEIHNEIDATKRELLKAITLVLERGDKLAELVVQSEELAQSANVFKHETKKLNSCC